MLTRPHMQCCSQDGHVNPILSWPGKPSVGQIGLFQTPKLLTLPFDYIPNHPWGWSGSCPPKLSGCAPKLVLRVDGLFRSIRCNRKATSSPKHVHRRSHQNSTSIDVCRHFGVSDCLPIKRSQRLHHPPWESSYLEFPESAQYN